MEEKTANLLAGQPMGEKEFTVLKQYAELDAHQGNLSNINVQDNVRLVNRVLELKGQEPISTAKPLPELTDQDLAMIIDHSLNYLSVNPENEMIRSKIRLIAEIRRIQTEQEKQK